MTKKQNYMIKNYFVDFRWISNFFRYFVNNKLNFFFEQRKNLATFRKFVYNFRDTGFFAQRALLGVTPHGLNLNKNVLQQYTPALTLSHHKP